MKCGLLLQLMLESIKRVKMFCSSEKTTKHKRKAPEEVDAIEKKDAQSPVHSLHRQFRIHSGLGDPKPPKKKKKTGRETNPSPSDSISTVSSSKPSTESVKKPTPVVCKKKKGACKHIVAFGDHYNEIAWKKYADHVKSLSSMTEVLKMHIKLSQSLF